MDQKSKMLLITFFILIAASVLHMWYKYVLLNDFTTFTEEEDIPEITF